MSEDDTLAIHGGAPIRRTMLPYGRQSIDDADVAAVSAALRSDWLTTGPRVAAFEEAFAHAVGAPHAVAVSSGTAALHAAMFAAGIGPGDEVIVPAVTFVATANCVAYRGAKPVFADVNPETLLVDPEDVAAKVTPRTKAVIAVDFAGQPCDYAALGHVAGRNRIAVVGDACHALGARVASDRVGSIADLTAFSLHPVKHVTAGEGGVVTTASHDHAKRMRRFRNHGIATDQQERAEAGTWRYDMVDLGFNYRITDFQCALATTQLAKLPASLARRREIARRYDEAFVSVACLHPLATRQGVEHAYHLYVVRLALDRLTATRDEVFAAMRAEGIGVNVHYAPVHLHPYYRTAFGTHAGLCPAAERVAEEILTLPMFPTMTDGDVDDVVAAVTKVGRAYIQ